MVRLKSGDRVNCRIKNYHIVVSYREYDEIKTFEVVAADDDGVWLFVPDYYIIRETVKIDQRRIQHLHIDPRFIDEDMVYVRESHVCEVVYVIDGLRCHCCGEFYQMAVPNQEDGKTFLCWSCRFNPYH